MRYLYTFFFYLSLPFILLRLLWRARKNPAYAARWSERFGYLPNSAPKQGIWLHAVSVGETIAAIPLVHALREQYPTLPIVVTTTTPTGADRVNASLKNLVTHYYLPYDLPGALNRFFNTLQPQLGIIMETELWPNLFQVCHTHKIPLFIANARLSARSAKGYQRIARLTRDMMHNVSQMAVQTATEAQRFIQLGLDPARITVTGSIKFDLTIPADLLEQASQLRAQWGKERLIWIAASTHEGEEEQILASYSLIRKKLPQTLLVLVPRHPDRFAKVIATCQRQGYATVLRSENKPCTTTSEIFIGDSMGELLLFYAASDVAFVGGSLITKGGHNPLEPAAVGIPIVMGPSLFNFAAISEQLQQAGALVTITSPTQLAEQVLLLFQDDTRRREAGEKGRQFVIQNRGALAKHLALINQLLTTRPIL